MIVAFLDLLGFSTLLQTNAEVALDNMNAFNNIIRTRFTDNKQHPIEEYEKRRPRDDNFRKFVEKSNVTAFSEMISFSDSLVLGGNDCNLFILQLANFVATAYINYSESFREPFTNMDTVKSYGAATANRDGSIRYHNAAPLLFRGGISVGEKVTFFNEYHIHDDDFNLTSLNVQGLTYLNAVNLEKTGKGPRLFCDESVVENVNDEVKKMIREVDKEKGIYEIVWTIEGCEATGCVEDKWDNIKNRITEKMLPVAINLYLYYKDNKKLENHYRELLNLVCTGIIKYAAESQLTDKTIQCINELLSQKIQSEIQFDRTIIDSFIK